MRCVPNTIGKTRKKRVHHRVHEDYFRSADKAPDLPGVSHNAGVCSGQGREMNIDINTEFGRLQPLMSKLRDHIKTDSDPKTNGNRYNIVWGLIYDYMQQGKKENGDV